MKIGIFGGSFNPIHLGHTALAGYICNLGLVDEVWLMVTPRNPFKMLDNMLPEDIRLHLAELAVKDFPHVRVSDFEFHLNRPSYTFVTLEKLSNSFPRHSFSLIIGEDNWLKFSSWRNSDEILARYPVIVYPRRKEDGEANKSANQPAGEIASKYDVHILTSAPLYPISSTEIRLAIGAGLDMSEWLDPAVAEYIRENGLYRHAIPTNNSH